MIILKYPWHNGGHVLAKGETYQEAYLDLIRGVMEVEDSEQGDPIGEWMEAHNEPLPEPPQCHPYTRGARLY